MNLLFQNIYTLSIVALLVGTSLYADIDKRLDVLEKEMEQIAVGNPQGTLGANFPSAQVCLNQPTNLFVTFDLLYWHAKVGGSEYAYSLQPNLTNNSSLIQPPVKGQYKDNDFGWDFGAKFGIGYNVSSDGWDLYGNYTWFSAHSSDGSTKKLPSALMPLRTFIRFIAQSAKSSFDVDTHDLYLELGRNDFVSSQLAFRPSFGVKSSWIDLEKRITYSISSLNDRPDLTGLETHSKDSSNLWGIGPQVSIDGKWFLGNGFNLFAEGAASLLYSYFKVNHKEKVPENLLENADCMQPLIKMRSQYHRYVPYSKLALGLAYNTDINQKKQHLTLKLGYEAQYYWRANQMLRDLDSKAIDELYSSIRAELDPSSVDLMLYGFKGEFRIDF